jgi:hypothetical protein
MLNEIFKLTGSRPNELEKRKLGNGKPNAPVRRIGSRGPGARMQGIIKLVVTDLSTAPEANPGFERLRM